MNDLFKIGDISQKLNITSRTLRYYEEIGLIQSTRKADSKYRYYDVKTLTKISQILMLRNFTFSIKEIQEMFFMQNSNVIKTIFSNKLNALKFGLRKEAFLINMIEKMISVINLNFNKNQNLLTIIENVFNCMSKTIDDTSKDCTTIEVFKINDTLVDIRILKLRPMGMAYYCASSDHPEDDAWNIMRDWIKKIN